MHTLPAPLRPDRSTLVWGALIVNTELLVVLAYFALTSPPTTPEFVLLALYPWIWFNASLWGVTRTDAPPAASRRRAVAIAVGVGYFLVLAYVGGVLQPGLGERATGVRFVAFAVPPGFSPALLYSGAAVVVNLIPFKVVGYAALSYLVYVTVLDAAESAAAGVVGLFACVSCTFPVVAAVVGTVFGSSAAVAVADRSYGLSTVVFALTVVLLSWRPTVGDFARLRARLAGR